MITIDGKEYRNLQEQVEKNKDDIARLQSGITISKSIDFADISSVLIDENVGKYYLVKKDEKEYLYIITRRLNDGLLAKSLGEYPAVVKGAKGDKGDKGDTGVGHGIIGNGSSVPSNDFGTDGDYFIVNLATHTYLYKKVDGVWTNQLDLKGVKGNDGCNVAVYANTADVASEYLNKLKVAGVQYALLGNNDTNFTGTTRLENIIVTGDSVFDDIAITAGGEISGDLIPSSNYTYQIGTSDYPWSYGYFGEVYADELYGDIIYENGVSLENIYQPKEKAMTLIETITTTELLDVIDRTYNGQYKKIYIEMTIEASSNNGGGSLTVNTTGTYASYWEIFKGTVKRYLSVFIENINGRIMVLQVENSTDDLIGFYKYGGNPFLLKHTGPINRIEINCNDIPVGSEFKIYGVEE